jgi:hypothetical protein
MPLAVLPLCRAVQTLVVQLAAWPCDPMPLGRGRTGDCHHHRHHWGHLFTHCHCRHHCCTIDLPPVAAVEGVDRPCLAMIAPPGIGVLIDQLLVMMTSVILPCLAAILRSPASEPVICHRCVTIRLWRGRHTDCHCRHCRCPDHRPPHPILRLIVVSLLSSPLSWINVVVIIASLPSQTYQLEQWRVATRKTLWRQSHQHCCSTLAGSQRTGKVREEKVVIFIFIGVAADTVFFQETARN